MQALLNQHSYILMALVILLAVAVASLWVRSLPARALLIGLPLIALVLFPLLLRTGPSEVRDMAEVEGALGRGKPVLLFLYSDF